MVTRKNVHTSLEKHRGKNVKMTGRFIYFRKSCKILNCDTLEEYLIEYNETFIKQLKNQDIPNYKMNGSRYIYQRLTLFGHIDKMNNAYIFVYHRHKF